MIPRLAFVIVPIILAATAAAVLLMLPHLFAGNTGPTAPANGVLRLPEPRRDGTISVESALRQRRSVREYRHQPLRLDEISQLLWAAQGITDTQEGRRTAPSAGALYPLEVSLLVGQVEGLQPGIYRYRPADHTLLKVGSVDVRPKLALAALGQSQMQDAAAVIVLSAVYERTTAKYGQRGVRYVHLEAGHAAQNVYLQAVALGLGTVVVGAFDDAQVKETVDLLDREQPLYLMPVGKR